MKYLHRIAMPIAPPCLVTAVIIYGPVNGVRAIDSAVEQPDQDSAVNAPDQFAWETFVAVNQSAQNGTNDTIWETWALQQDVFADPNKKPVWPGNVHQPKIFSPSIKLQILLQQRLERRAKQLQLFRMDEKKLKLLRSTLE